MRVLYPMTKCQAAIRNLLDTMEEETGNLPSMPGIFWLNCYPEVLQASGSQVRMLNSA